MDGDISGKKFSAETRLVLGGRNLDVSQGFVNLPVFHGSTVLYRSVSHLLSDSPGYKYGRDSTPTTDALEHAIRDIEGSNCAGVSLLPSGLSALSTALLSVLRHGDHLLAADNVYHPTRKFCDTVLKQAGVETTYFDPLAGAAIAGQVRKNTKAILVESPGSLSFEMPDIAAIAGFAKSRDIAVLLDNSWATPLYYSALDKGVDISICAGTKYFGGHSDTMIGTISATDPYIHKIKDTVRYMGLCVGPDVAYLTLRGLRTLGVRLARHYQSALTVTQWMSQRPEVSRVLYPALESDPGHAIWRRDFTGASGLFSVVFKPVPEAAVHAFLDELQLFGLGFSWGGFESLAIPFDCSDNRTATKWNPEGPTVRFHIGLEEVNDLIQDLESGFSALNKKT